MTDLVDISPLRVIKSSRRKGDGYPLGEDTIAIAIEAEATAGEALRICECWETGECYSVEIAGDLNVGQVRGNVKLVELDRGKYHIEFELHRPNRVT